MRQRVGVASTFGPAASRAALVEKHGVKAFRIEQGPMIRLAPAARAAVQTDGRDSADAADGLHVKRARVIPISDAGSIPVVRSI